MNPNVSYAELADMMMHIIMTCSDLVDTDVNFAFVDVIVHFPLKPRLGFSDNLFVNR